MEFVKKNYEKVLLGVVLFGLVVAVGFMVYLVSNEQQRLAETRNSILNRPVKPLTPVDLTRYDAALTQAATPVRLDLSDTNKLFNPVRWVRAVNGSLIPSPVGHELNALEVSNIRPLYLTIAFASVYVPDASSRPRYDIEVQREGASRPAERGKRPFYLSEGDKTELFTLLAVNGPPDKPTSLSLELNSSGNRISISKDKPYQRVDGYTANLKYPPQNKYYLNRRVGDVLNVAGDNYNIVAISDKEVVLSAQSNGKKYTIRYTAAP